VVSTIAVSMAAVRKAALVANDSSSIISSRMAVGDEEAATVDVAAFVRHFFRPTSRMAVGDEEAANGVMTADYSTEIVRRNSHGGAASQRSVG